MDRPTASVVDCPTCSAPLVHLRLGDDLALLSCSRCDSRWWWRGDQPAELGEVLEVVAGAGRARPAVTAI